MQGALWVALGGALGACARYGAGALALRVFGANFPWGVLAINVAGSFAIAILADLAARNLLSEQAKLIAITGFLGAFTTFSAFSLDTFVLLEKGRLAAAALYVAGSVSLSLGAFALAWTLLGRWPS